MLCVCTTILIQMHRAKRWHVAIAFFPPSDVDCDVLTFMQHCHWMSQLFVVCSKYFCMFRDYRWIVLQRYFPPDKSLCDALECDRTPSSKHVMWWDDFIFQIIFFPFLYQCHSRLMRMDCEDLFKSIYSHSQTNKCMPFRRCQILWITSPFLLEHALRLTHPYSMHFSNFLFYFFRPWLQLKCIYTVRHDASLSD